VTAAAGHYPPALASAIVTGAEKCFDFKWQSRTKVFDTCPAEAEDGEDDVETNVPVDEVYESDSDLDVGPAGEEEIDPAVMRLVVKLHQNTGHRSNKRLARALIIAGAPAEAVRAAKNLKCDVCQESKSAKSRRPAALPRARDVNDVAHIDLVQMEAADGTKWWVVHITDSASRCQAAALLRNKSTTSVIKFLNTVWVPVFGAPSSLVVDMGPEFTSMELESWASSHSTFLYHAAVEAPWQNGIAEKSGGILKVIMHRLIKEHSCISKADLRDALAAACDAYNVDCNETGFSPSQWAIGRNPRRQGSLLHASFTQRLAEHSLLDSDQSYVRRTAIRETARIALTQLHYSNRMRRAELARTRVAVTELKTGDIVYFFREQKLAPKNSRKGSC
jgi:transposase InsO family protein